MLIACVSVKTYAKSSSGDDSNTYGSNDEGHEQTLISAQTDNDTQLLEIHEPSGPFTYKFGFDTGLDAARHFREEQMDINGTVRGRFGLLDQWGRFRIAEYIR